MRGVTNDGGQVEDSGYWISLSDLLAGLLIIFILALCYAVLSYSEERDSVQEAQQQLAHSLQLRSQILQAIEDSLHAQDSEIVIAIDLDRGAIHLQEGVLFGSGQASLSDRGVATLCVLGPIVHAVLTEDRYTGHVETVSVEGHTDDRPIGAKLRSRFESNWELSTQRAINAWRTMRESADLDTLTNDRGQPLFSCSGYAETRPVSLEGSENARRLNRRIDLRFTMTPPAESEYWERTIANAIASEYRAEQVTEDVSE